jgi:hypothetical protein
MTASPEKFDWAPAPALNAPRRSWRPKTDHLYRSQPLSDLIASAQTEETPEQRNERLIRWAERAKDVAAGLAVLAAIAAAVMWINGCWAG